MKITAVAFHLKSMYHLDKVFRLYFLIQLLKMHCIVNSTHLDPFGPLTVTDSDDVEAIIADFTYLGILVVHQID